MAVLLSACCIFQITDEYITNAPLYGVLPEGNGRIISNPKVIKGPSDMKGSVLNYQNQNGEGQILVDEVGFFQDSDDNVFIGKLIGKDLTTNTNIDFDGSDIVKENNWTVLNSFDNFVWKVDEDFKMKIDRLRLENIEIDGQAYTQVSELVGQNIKYEKPGPPVKCIFTFSAYCGSVPPCNFIDSLSISCSGAPPLCYCLSTIPNCPSIVSFWCKKVECDNWCKTLGRRGEEVGCFCDL